jgi:metal-responsive CopG/Arc/MetJ family transcriptional regulator
MIPTRFNVILPLDMAQDMQDLVDETGHSRGEIFRRAMTLYKKAIETRSAGGNVILRDEDGTLRDVVGLGI